MFFILRAVSKCPKDILIRLRAADRAESFLYITSAILRKIRLVNKNFTIKNRLFSIQLFTNCTKCYIIYNVFIQTIGGGKMNTDFPRIISLLRKERNISQKQAAADLGVSQALLSHYEKGIRECGLDFIVRAADYYNVSCDYLLGRSPEPEGRIISCDSDDPMLSEPEGIGARGRKLFVDSADLLLSEAGKTGNVDLIKAVSDYLMLAVYRMFRIIYSSDPSNDMHFFAVPDTVSESLTDAAMSISRASAEQSAPGDTGTITTNALSEKYPSYAPSLFSAVKESEKLIMSAFSLLYDEQKNKQ